MRTFSNCVSFSLSSLETKQTRGKKPRNQVKSTHVSSNGHQCVKRRKHTHTKKSWLLDSSMSLRKLEYKQASFSASFNYTMLLSWKSRLTALFYSCAFGHRFIFFVTQPHLYPEIVITVFLISSVEQNRF